MKIASEVENIAELLGTSINKPFSENINKSPK